MKKLIQYVFALLLILSNQLVFAHGGEDHGDTKQKMIVPKNYFVSVSNSDKYELLLKYKPFEKGEETTMQLFVSDFNTNMPVDKANIKITSNDNKDLKFAIKQTDVGVFTITTSFPEEKAYSINVSINSALGADLMVLQNIEVGKELPKTDMILETKKSLFDNPLMLFVGGFLLALILVFGLNKLKSKKLNSSFLIVLTLFGTTPLPIGKLKAHGGEEHGDSKKSGGSYASAIEVPKETQFLFDIYTKYIEAGDFTESTKLFGTIIPSSGGQAIVSVPQNGKIISLSVNVGQAVKQGQVLAVIEQNIDAAAQVNLLAEKNNIDAEFEAAKKEFSESEARYQKASENKKLYGSSGGKTILLKSPIDGIVGNFTFSIGSTVNANETIFTVTNLSKVYVEAQVFDKDAEKINKGVKYTVECTNDNHKTAEVKLLALAQSINPTNQSQRVLFESENLGGEFKIGEFVNISVFAPQSERQIALPNSAISELNGKPIVFVKDGAEQFSMSYVSLGENNGTYTVIKKGIEEGERVVTNGTYQLKMIYLNQ